MNSKQRTPLSVSVVHFSWAPSLLCFIAMGFRPRAIERFMSGGRLDGRFVLLACVCARS